MSIARLGQEQFLWIMKKNVSVMKVLSINKRTGFLQTNRHILKFQLSNMNFMFAGERIF